jgi:glyoxylase-like metal-dependent hydrolase (beta-lactamase superfamily II)
MELSKTTIGPFSLYTIETGRFKLDGGAMFGVVPKPLWSRKIDADAKNRILMAMRCLLVESQQTGRLYLIDNGIGTKFNEKMSGIYDIDHQHSELHSSLQQHGFTADDITDVIFTHLHFDHCGGTTYYDDGGEINHTFKNATYHVTKKHFETATNPNIREQASFLADNIEPLVDSDRLNLVEEHHQYEAGLRTLSADGHTLGQHLPKIEAGGKTVIFAADLLPSHVHLPMPWIMGYDMRPINTLEEKEAFLDEAIEKKWYIYLEHDPQMELMHIHKQKGKYGVAEELTLNDI